MKKLTTIVALAIGAIVTYLVTRKKTLQKVEPVTQAPGHHITNAFSKAKKRAVHA